ncbi:MAG TPA: GYD domain-containing protein [Candidatus Acidoferrum sp.]|nr:GYD domain-containing protein [Candidatus Acidoferrum sp.]
MPHYLLQAAYTPEAWQAMIKNPHNRIEAVRPAVERLGGKLIGGWAAFGDYDTILIVELPASVDAAALAIAAAGGGSCRAIKTTPLLTAEEAVEAARKASTSGYRPVAASAAAAK